MGLPGGRPVNGQHDLSKSLNYSPPSKPFLAAVPLTADTT